MWACDANTRTHARGAHTFAPCEGGDWAADASSAGAGDGTLAITTIGDDVDALNALTPSPAGLDMPLVSGAAGPVPGRPLAAAVGLLRPTDTSSAPATLAGRAVVAASLGAPGSTGESLGSASIAESELELDGDDRMPRFSRGAWTSGTHAGGSGGRRAHTPTRLRWPCPTARE